MLASAAPLTARLGDGSAVELMPGIPTSGHVQPIDYCRGCCVHAHAM